MGDGLFVDGGLTPFNDLAPQLLMVVTFHGLGFKCRTGENNLLVISVEPDE